MDYEASSSRDKERINLLVTTNTSGKVGCGIPLDMACEHKVKTVKGILKSFHSNLETTLITKTVLAQNSQLLMKDHLLDSFGKGHNKSGGDHRHDYFTNEEKEIVRNEFRRLKMFSSEMQTKNVYYNVKIRTIWENMKNENVDRFLDRNCENYRVKKFYRLT